MAKPFLLLPLLIGVAQSGCDRRPTYGPPITATIATVSLFDSDDASHPSPRDSRWTINNQPLIARMTSVVRSEADGPPPTCPAVGSVELVVTSGATNCFSILHIHHLDRIRLQGPGGEFVVRNGDEVLRGLAVAGIPTNKFFATAAGE
jgi:hypothetical protein